MKKSNDTTNSLFYLIIICTICLALFLSFNGIISLTHGPLYYYYADGILEHKKFVDNIFVIPEPISNPQFGISFVHLIGIFLLGENFSFIFYILTVSLLWICAYTTIIKNKFFFLSPFEKIFLFIIIFFQPYNLNQISNFSNESVYFPLLIIFFFKIIKFIKKNNSSQLLINKKDIIIFVFLFIGGIFRVHHYVFFASLIFYFLISKNYKLFFLFSLFFLLTILNYIFFIKNFLPLAYNNIIDFSVNLLNSNLSIKYEAISNKSDIEHFFKVDSIFWIKLTNASSIFSFFLYTKKIFKDSYFIILVFNLFFFILFINSKKIIHYKDKIFSRLSLIFITFSFVFIFLLPIFEYSYLLPTSFIIIIYFFILFKTIFEKKFLKILFSLLFFYMILISLAFSIRNPYIETFEYRDDFRYFKSIVEKYSKDNMLLYIDHPNATMPEFYRWISKTKICNYRMPSNECAKIENKKNIKYIIIKIIKSPKIEFNLEYINELNNYEQNLKNTILILTKKN